MLGGFKLYLGLIFILIGAQIVVAGENVVDFQRALKAYEKEREPNQESEVEESKTRLKNPPMEIKVKKEKVEKKENKET